MEYIKARYAFIKEIKFWVEDFLKLHGTHFEHLKMEDLKVSNHFEDRRIYDYFNEEENWVECILEVQLLDLVESVFTDEVNLKQEKSYNDPKNSDLSPSAVYKENVDENNDWKFDFNVGYFYTLLPNRIGNGSVSMVSSRAFAVINNDVTAQPDVLDSDTIPFTYETPKADAIIGCFDNKITDELVLCQINNTIALDIIQIDSVKDYRRIYSEETTYFTKSLSCNVLQIPGKEQIITAKLSATELGFELYYFENGIKVLLGTSILFEHKIGNSGIMAFDFSISDELNNGNLEIVTIISKSNDPEKNLFKNNVQTNIIKTVLNISSKSFSFVCNQIITMLKTSAPLFADNTVQQIYQYNNFIVFNYLNTQNSWRIQVMAWDVNEFKPVWNDDFDIALPNYWHDASATLFYRNKNVFYFVHVYQQDYEKTGEEYAASVEIYNLQESGSLTKVNSIKFPPTSLNPVENFWGGLFIQGSLYLLRTGSEGIEFYNVDEAGKKVNLLPITVGINQGVFGKPIMALSNYQIKAQAPKLTSLTENLQTIAVLDSPPISSLINYSDGSNFPSLMYQFQQRQSGTKNVQTRTERTQSDDLQAGLKIFGLSLGAKISKNISDTSEQVHENQFQITQDTQITSSEQDMIVFLGLTYDIYEYPITLNGDPCGHFLFIVPTSSPHLIVNTGQLAFRKTSNQIGNLLSYPTMQPDDIQSLLYTNEFSINANDNYISTLSYSDLTTTSSTTTATTTVSKSASLDIEFPIVSNVAGSINGSIQGSYNESQINICSFTIENSFQLSIQIQRLLNEDARKYFSIQPYFYIDKAGIIRCRYRVDVPAGGSTTPTYWKEYYQYPDFAMVMPFNFDEFKGDSKYYLSFDIQTIPSNYIKDLTSLEIAVEIHNWSLVSGTNIEVAFYYAKAFSISPQEIDLIELGRKTIDIIQPRQSKKISYTWKNPFIIHPINAVPIYVKIDPDNKVTQTSTTNKFAQMNYPIESLKEVLGLENQE